MLEAVDIRREVSQRCLLENISLSIRAGERIALVGSSGSGKTLLLRSLAMLDPVDAGEIRWHGKIMGGDDVPEFRSRVMYLQQRPTLFEGTVEENVRQPYALTIHHHKPFDRSRIVTLLEALRRSSDFLSKQQRDLSVGEAQLTALLRAMQLDPDILLLDEPTAALDPEVSKLVERLVANWLDEQPKQRATVWITHDHHQARRVASTVLSMRDGRLDESR